MPRYIDSTIPLLQMFNIDDIDDLDVEVQDASKDKEPKGKVHGSSLALSGMSGSAGGLSDLSAGDLDDDAPLSNNTRSAGTAGGGLCPPSCDLFMSGC
jgi:hypothetical protein